MLNSKRRNFVLLLGDFLFHLILLTPSPVTSNGTDGIKYQRRNTPNHAIGNSKCEPDYSFLEPPPTPFNASKATEDNVVGNIVQYSIALQEHMQGRRRRRRRGRGRRKLFFLRLIDWSFFTSFLFGDSFEEAFSLDEAFFDQDREALMFLTHLMGDLHQPLHCGCGQDRVGLNLWVDFLNYWNRESHPVPFVCMILPDFLTPKFFYCDLNLVSGCCILHNIIRFTSHAFQRCPPFSAFGLGL